MAHKELTIKNYNFVAFSNKNNEYYYVVCSNEPRLNPYIDAQIKVKPVKSESMLG